MSIEAPERTTDRQVTVKGVQRIEELALTPRAVVQRYVHWLITIVNLTVFFVAWELFARTQIINPLFLPAPSRVFEALYDGFASGLIGPELQISVRNFTIGLTIACAIGIPVGLVMGVSRLFDTVLSPYVWTLAALPKVAIVPILVLILGFSHTAKIVLIFLSAFFPIVINCMAGPKTVEESLLRAAKVFGASKVELYRKVILPFTLPFIISGINQGLTRGLVGLVVAEMFTGNDGLGWLIIRAGQTFNSGLMYGVLLLLAVLSLVFVQAFRWLEFKIAPWRQLSGI